MQGEKRLPQRSLHVHTIRKKFHKQLRRFWQINKTLQAYDPNGPNKSFFLIFEHDKFRWLPLATSNNGLFCGLDILMLRSGDPGNVVHDLDNRIKTIFDALRKPKGPHELGCNTPQGQQTPGADETPFYVLLEDDRLITRAAVTSDVLLEDVPEAPGDEAVRLVISVTVRPYHVGWDTVNFV
jgi:hypothetical protein